MQQDEKRKQQSIAENNETYRELKLRSKAVLPSWDNFMDRLSRKEK
jgi:hypothetical protein